MSKVTFIVSEYDQSEHAVIEHADGTFTSMSKAHYEELEANKVEHLTEIPTV